MTQSGQDAPSPRKVPRAAVALLAAAWILPFVQHHHRLPVPSFLSEWIAVVAGLLLCGFALWEGRRRQLALPAVALLPIGMAALLAAHALVGASAYRHSAGVAVLYMLWAGAMVLAGRWLAGFDKEDAVRCLGWCLVVGAGLASLVGVIQMFELRGFLDPVVSRYAGRVSGNLGSPNHFALYIALGSASLIHLAASRRVPGYVAAVLMLPLMFVLAASGSRSGWIYLGAILLACGAWRLQAKDAIAGRAVGFCALALLAYLLCNLGLSAGWLGPTGTGSAADRMLAASPLTDLRSRLWLYAVRMSLDHPLFGVGWGNFAWELFQRSDGRLWAGWNYDANAHNLLLHLAAETGLAGLAVLLVPLGFWWIRTIRPVRGAAWYWGATLLGLIGLHAMLEYTLWYAYFLGIAALLAGWMDPGRRALGPEGGTGLVPVLLLLTGGWVAGQTLHDHRVLEKALDPVALEVPGGTPEIITDMVAMQSASLLVPELERVLGMGLLADAGRMSQTLAMSDRIVRHAPTPIHVFRHAVLLQLSRQDEAALRLFDRGLMLFGHLDDVARVASDTLAAGDRIRAGAMAPLRQRLSDPRPAAPSSR
jgi:O-antigen ligase